jgi:ABC-type transporter Mla MlaB component
MSTQKRSAPQRRADRARTTLALEGPLTIYEAREAKARLIGALERAASLDIDLAMVTEIDTAGVQLLVLAKTEAVAAGRSARLVNHSPAVLDAIDLYRLGAFLGDPLSVRSARKGTS